MNCNTTHYRANSSSVPGDPTRIVLPAMVNVHMVIGLGEALITTLVIFAVWQTRREILDDGVSCLRPERRGFDVILPDGTSVSESGTASLAEPAATVPSPRSNGGWEFILFGLLIAIALALFVTPFASQSPDGLEKVSMLLGFDDRKPPGPTLPSPLPDYKLPGLTARSPMWATGLAGLIGTLVVFGLALLLARLLMSRARGSQSAPAAP